jgi:hypothetical protein
MIEYELVLALWGPHCTRHTKLTSGDAEDWSLPAVVATATVGDRMHRTPDKVTADVATLGRLYGRSN